MCHSDGLHQHHASHHDPSMTAPAAGSGLFAPSSPSPSPSPAVSPQVAAHRAHVRMLRDQADTRPSRPRAEQLKAWLGGHLRERGIGARWQATEFTRRLATMGLIAEGDDLRCLGGMVAGLVKSGVLRHVGFAPTGGDPSRNHNSSMRPVYEIRSREMPSTWPAPRAVGV